MDYVCSKCGKRLGSKKTLKQHEKIQHGNVRFECSQCTLTFTRKANLEYHTKSIHNRDGGIHGKLSQRKRCLSAASSQLAVQEGKLLRTPRFECETCHKTFATQKQCRRHKDRVHNVDIELYICHYCSRSFNRKENMVRHIANCIEKVRRLALAPAQNQSMFTCLHCGEMYLQAQSLNAHYINDHDVAFVYENFEFKDYDAFEDWKNKLHREESCQFFLWNKHETATSFVRHFVCHRSGVYTNDDNERTRFPKLHRSKKLNGWCPAGFHLTEQKNTKTLEVKLQQTHVGHSITSKSELTFLSLDKREKRSIKDILSRGVEENVLFRTYESQFVPMEQLERNNAVKYDDIANILREPKKRSDAEDVAKFIFEHQQAILFCKKENSTVSSYPELEKDDFVLVYMDEFQEELLRKFGGNVIAYDSTHGTNPKSYLLHTILVINETWEGIGVAFMLTNRNDGIVLKVFLDLIRKKIGILCPETLMTDMQTSMYNAFTEVMGEPKSWLWCIWHVFDSWRKNKNKIAIKEKRKMVLKDLYKLTQETDKNIFKANLKEFLDIGDPDLQTFVQYFRRQYVPHIEQWAYCFRIRKHMNTNMCLEAFHRSIKRMLFANKRKKRSLFKCLCALDTYVTINKTRRNLQDIGLQRRNIKLTTLRRRHHTAKNFGNHCMVEEFQSTVGGTACSWLVSSFPLQMMRKEGVSKEDSNTEDKHKDRVTDKEDAETQAQQMYVVQKHLKVDVTSQSLRCDLCDIGFDEFSCTCIDYLICCNMCKHIHVVGLLLKKKERQLGAVHKELKEENELESGAMDVHAEEDNSIELSTEDAQEADKSMELRNENLEEAGTAKMRSDFIACIQGMSTGELESAKSVFLHSQPPLFVAATRQMERTYPKKQKRLFEKK